MPTELGLHNSRIERVRDLRTTRGRRSAGQFSVEGPTLIAEAQRSGLTVRELYAVPGALASRPDLAALENTGVPVFTLAPKLFARLSDVETPTGVLAVVDMPEADPQAIVDRAGTILLLAGISDPGNAGTLFRSAEAFGAAGAFVGIGGVDPYAPKVVRAAMGSLFRLPVATVEAGWLLEAAAAAGRSIIAADTEGLDIGEVTLPPNVVLAIGNERRGVRDWLPRWDLAVRIPQRGPAESLNAAMAGSIILYVLSSRR